MSSETQIAPVVVDNGKPTNGRKKKYLTPARQAKVEAARIERENEGLPPVEPGRRDCGKERSRRTKSSHKKSSRS